MKMAATTTERAEIERRFVDEVWNHGDLAVVDEIHAPGGHIHWSPGFANVAELKDFVEEVRTGFPDFHMTVEFVLEDDDMVTVGYTASGTNRGPMGGLPPTGKFVRFGGLWTHRYEDDTVVEGWATWDQLGINEQLGLTFPRVLLTLPTMLARRLVEAIRER